VADDADCRLQRLSAIVIKRHYYYYYYYYYYRVRAKVAGVKAARTQMLLNFAKNG